MRLKIRRRIRTTNSEQWTLFDLDQTDSQGDVLNIGKIDLHYDLDTVYGTLLLWKEFTEGYTGETLQPVIDAIVGEATEPIGVAGDYSIDYFTPSLAEYKFFSNFDLEEEDDEDDDEDEDEDNEDEGEDNEETTYRSDRI